MPYPLASPCPRLPTPRLLPPAPDFKCTLYVTDRSLSGVSASTELQVHDHKMALVLFCRSVDVLPQLRRVGDIIHLKNVGVRPREG